MPEFIGFCGPAYEAQSRTQDTQRLINLYVEVDPTKRQGYAQAQGMMVTEGQRGRTTLYPTPGTVFQLQLQVGEVRAFHVLPGSQTLLAISGNAVYSVNTALVATIVGTLLTSSGAAYIADNGVAAYITDGSRTRYYYDWGTSTFAWINDGPFTGGAVCGEVDNFMFYTRAGTNQFGCTNVGDVVSNSLNLGSKIGESDNLMSIWGDHRQLLLLGERESECWINAGSFPFPFAIIPGTSIQHGLQAVRSVARLGEGIAYLAKDSRGQQSVVLWGATIGTPKLLSTHAISNEIQGYAVTSDAVGYSYAQSGHEFYVLSFPSADVTWCYDLSENQWHQRAWRDSQNVLHRHRGNCAVLFNGQVLVGDWQNGMVYAFSQSTYTDNGDPIPCIRRAPHLTTDLQRQFFSDLQIQFQPGVGVQSGQGSDPECILRWSNDGGFTFGNDHVLKVGKVGQYTRRAMCRRLGWARDRVFELEMSDPVWRVIVSANLNAQPGSS